MAETSLFTDLIGGRRKEKGVKDGGCLSFWFEQRVDGPAIGYSKEKGRAYFQRVKQSL